MVNSAGETTSQFTPILTQEAAPEHVLPPTVNTDSSQLYVIHLSWKIPGRPNGEFFFYFFISCIEFVWGALMLYCPIRKSIYWHKRYNFHKSNFQFSVKDYM